MSSTELLAHIDSALDHRALSTEIDLGDKLRIVDYGETDPEFLVFGIQAEGHKYVMDFWVICLTCFGAFGPLTQPPERDERCCRACQERMLAQGRLHLFLSEIARLQRLTVN